MSKQALPSLDWDDIRFFLAANRAGSLASAARYLKVSVATVGRRLDRLEEAVGHRLFHRHAAGLSLTDRAEGLLEHAESVGECVNAFERTAAGTVDGLDGVVSICCLESIAAGMLAPKMAEFRKKYPRIQLTIESGWRITPLSARRTDIAVRVNRPNEERVVARRVGTVRYGVYATKAYLDEHGYPEDDLQDLSAYDAVVHEPRLGTIPEVVWFESREKPPRFALRLTSLVGIYEAVRGGIGLGILPNHFPVQDLVQLAGEDQLPDRDLWLAIHEDLADSPRIRASADFCVEAIQAAVGPPKRV